MNGKQRLVGEDVVISGTELPDILCGRCHDVPVAGGNGEDNGYLGYVRNT